MDPTGLGPAACPRSATKRRTGPGTQRKATPPPNRSCRAPRSANSRRTSARPAVGQRRQPRNRYVRRSNAWCDANPRGRPRTRAALRDLAEHPPGAVKHRRQHQANTSCNRNRPPATKAKNPRQPPRMPGREQTLEKLLRRKDRDQSRSTHRPQPQKRNREPRQRPLPSHRAPQRPQEPANRQRDQHHHPRHHRMQIRMASALQLGPRSRPICEVVPQLMHRKRRRRHQNNRPQAPNPGSKATANAHRAKTIPRQSASRRFCSLFLTSHCQKAPPRVDPGNPSVSLEHSDRWWSSSGQSSRAGGRSSHPSFGAALLPCGTYLGSEKPVLC